MGTRDEYIEQMKAQLDAMNQKLEKLEDKSKAARKETKAKYKEQISELRKQSKQANAKLSELKASGEETWDNSVAELEKISEALKHSYNYFKSQL